MRRMQYDRLSQQQLGFLFFPASIVISIPAVLVMLPIVRVFHSYVLA